MSFRLDHRFTQKNLSAYLDGRLTASERERVERHVSACSRCQEELVTLRSTVELLHQVPSVPLPRSFELPASAKEERERYQFWRRAHAVLRTATAVVSLLLVVLLSSDLAISLGVISLPKRAAETAPPGVMMQREVDKAPRVSEAHVPAPSPTAGATEIEEEALPSPPPRVEAEEPLKEAPQVAERAAGGAGPERDATQTASVREPEAKMLESERAPEPSETLVTPTATLRPPTPTPSATPKPTATMVPLPTRERVSSEPARPPYWRVWGLVRTGWTALSGLLLVLVAGLLWSWQKRRLR